MASNGLKGLRLSLLGSPQLERDGNLLTIGRQKAFGLFSYLVVTNQTQRRETLIALLWPDVEPALAYSYLRRDLSVLNKVLGTGWLEIDRYNISMVGREDFWFDIAHFREKLGSCGSHGHQWDEICLDCMTQLSEAVALYRGDFLSGFNLPDSLEFDDWKTFETQSLRADMVSALNRLIYGYSSQGKYSDAIACTRRWLRLDPFHEAAHRQLMQLYAWEGNWSAARQHYEEFKLTLYRELQLVPEEATRQLYTLIQEKKVQEPPVWADNHSTRYIKPRHNVPPQLTPFIGREKELAEIKRLLRDEPSCRLLTLVGPGGIGKTRLALQAANQLLEEYTNGVFIVSLAAVDSADRLIPTIADALMLAFQGRAAPKNQLINYLREKQLLLVLDNFEQLLEGAEILLEILNNAPRIKLLITSRERLNLSPEWVQPILGLTYPEADEMRRMPLSDTMPIRNYSAVDLLLERASRIKPDLSLTPKDRAAAVEICRLVEGAPLGLELASSWTRLLSLAEIAEEIRRNLDFLAGPTRDTPVRHSSLRAIFEQSWQHLSEDEKQAYQKLSLFRGGFHRKAAEQIFGIPLTLLAGLTDKSLVYRSPSGRYNLHELSRQYAEEKLAEGNVSIGDLHDRYVAYYASHLQERERELRLGGQAKAMSEIGAEIDNLRRAWQWAIERCRVADIGRGAESLHLFYFAMGWVHEGRDILRDASSCLKSILADGTQTEHDVSLVYSRVLSRQARFEYRLGLHREAKDLLDESLHALQSAVDQGSLDARRERAISLFYMSVILRGDGKYQAAEELCHESLAYFEETQDLASIAMARKHLGIIAGSQGKYELAQQWLESALDLFQASGDSYGLADVLNDLGNVAIGLGEFAEAKRLNQECLAIRQKTNHLWGIGTSLNNLGYLALEQKQYEEARQLLERSLVIQREIGDLYQIANSLSNLGQAVFALLDHKSARSYYHEALRSAMKIGAHPLLLEILTGIAMLQAEDSPADHGRAVMLLEFVLQHPACDQMTKDRVNQALANLKDKLTNAEMDEAIQRGGALKLEPLVFELLG